MCAASHGACRDADRMVTREFQKRANRLCGDLSQQRGNLTFAPCVYVLDEGRGRFEAPGAHAERHAVCPQRQQTPSPPLCLCFLPLVDEK